MKITFFVPCLIGGGAERVVANLATYFANVHKYDVSVVTLIDAATTYPISSKVKVYPLWYSHDNAPRLIKVFKKIYRFIKFIYTKSGDVNISFLYLFNVSCLLFKPLMKGRLICTERNYPGSYSKCKIILLNVLGFFANAWVFQTQESAKFYLHKSVKRYFIQNAVSIKGKSEKIIKAKKIVAVGRLHPQKNFNVLIESFSEIVKKFPDYHLYIYGKGDEYQNLLNLIMSLNIKDKVHLVGFVNNIHAQIVDAEVFVMSSEYEGIPNALLEAMALGLPCVATDCLGGGAKLLISNKENGILVPRNNVKAIVDSVEELIENKELRDKISVNAKKVREEYSEKVIYEKWNAVFRDNLK